MADKRYEGGWDPSYRNFEEDVPSSPNPIWDFDSEISQLEKNLNAEIVVQGEKRHYYEHGGSSHGDSCIREDYTIDSIVDQPRIKKPNTKRRESSKKRLIEIYNNSHFPAAKHLAGRALSRNNIRDYPYSKTRLFVHEHLLIITMTAIAAAGATSGLGYFLYQYLTR